MVKRLVPIGRRLRASRGAVALAVVWLGAGLISAKVVLGGGVGSDLTPAGGTVTTDLETEMGQLPSAFKFSGVAHLPGTNSVLLVDDDADGHLVSWTVADLGARDGSPTAVPLPSGAKLEDAEGIATDGSYVYATGSHSLTVDGKPRDNMLVRMRWVGDSLVLDGKITDLQERLEASFPPVARVTGRRPDEGGLNIEGLAWDPNEERLLFGLRGPLFSGLPVVLAARVSGSGDSLALEFDPEPLAVPGLTGYGIRSIQYDALTNGYLVISGGVGRAVAATGGDNRFALWHWSGDPAKPAKRLVDFPKMIRNVEIRPEGVARVDLSDGGSYLLVVADDAPFYWKFDDKPAARQEEAAS